MFENPQQKNQESLPEIFAQEREMYIPEIGEQLREKKSVEIDIDGEHINVDYRIISLEEKENENADPVVLLTGFGSGWEGITELGSSMAYEGRKVILLSLPGYGNSDNLPRDVYEDAQDFSPEADALAQSLEKIKQENGLGGGRSCTLLAILWVRL